MNKSPPLPTLQFAVFDEFGHGACDRVLSHAHAVAAVERERCALRLEALAEDQRRCYDGSGDIDHLERAAAYDNAAKVLREAAD